MVATTLHAKPLLHPSIGFGNDDANAALPNLQMWKALAEEIVNVSNRETPTLCVPAFVRDVCRRR
jgi:hypothetical protein